MKSTTGTRLRRVAAIAAAVSLIGTYQWAGGGQFGPAADPVDPTRPVPQVESEIGDRIIRDDDFYRQRAYPNDFVPAGALVAAHAEADLLPVITETRALPTTDTVIAPGPLAPGNSNDFGFPTTPVEWSQVGTRGITGYVNPSDATFYNGTTPLSGRVVAIANHPTDSNTAYIGSPAGGLFKTTNGGTSWTPLFDMQTTLSVSSISIDPDSPDTVFVGTGEGFGGDYYGQGVFKSTNGGTTWTKLKFGVGDDDLDYCHVADMLALPGSNTVLAAVSAQRFSPPTEPSPTGACTTAALVPSTGVWYSADGGTTWSHVRQSSGVTDLALDSSTLTTVYGGDKDATMIDSVDSGATWFSTSTIVANAGNVKVAAGDANVVYAAVASAIDNSLLGVYKSTDAGINYTLLKNPAPADICNYPKVNPSDPLVAQCNYDFDLAVDTSPTGSDIVYLAGIFLGRSTDGGVNFSYFGNNPNDFSETKQIHVDVQKLSWDQSKRLWIGSDGGIQRTDGTTFTNINADLNLQQFQHGISTTPDGRLFGGTQDAGSTRYIGGPGWEMWQSGDGGAGAVDPSNTQIVYGTYIYGQAYKSTDGGATNTFLNSADCFGEGTSGCLFYSPMEMDPSNPMTIYGGASALYRTTDGWATQPAAISPSFAATISAIAPAASDDKVVYVGTSFGTLYVASDGGSTAPSSWPLRTTGLPTRAITDILVDPTDPDHAWVTLSGFGSGHVYETTDRGVTWTDRSGDLPDAPVNAIDADFRTSPANLFVGTDIGVYGSDSNGSSWAQYGTKLPKITTLDVVVNSARNTVTAATVGRGMWTAAAGCPVAANDLFSEAAALTGAAATATANNTCASSEFGEPRHNLAPTPLPTNTLWWKWVAPGNGTVEIDTKTSSIDTVLAAYTGDKPPTLTQVAQNDDISLSDVQSSVSFAVTAGTAYHIAVDGYSISDVGLVNLNLAAVLSPSAPTNVTTTVGNGAVTVSWDAAADNGSPVTGYTVTASPGGATCTTTTATSCTITGLTNGTAYTFSVTAVNAIGTGAAGTATATPIGQIIVALAPGRVYETRSLPNKTDDGQQTAQGRTTPGQIVQVQVAGRSGVPTDAVAAVLNITAIRPTTNGFITSFPCGTQQPNTAALNFAANQVIANGATIKLGTGGSNAGKVCIFTTAATDLVVDVTGYVPVGSQFGALAPGRVYETRSLPNKTDDGQQTAQGRTTPGQIVQVQVAGRANVPANADAVVLNITAIRPTTNGFITSFPCGTQQPNTAALNFAANQVIANGATIKLGTGGSNAGKVCIFTTAATDLVVDVTGYIPSTTQFGALAPGRVYETRSLPNKTDDGQQTAQGRTTPGQIVQVQVAGRAGVPANADAVVLNITAIRPTTNGFITSFPCGTQQPNTAALNFAANQVIANGATIKLGTGGSNAGKVCIFTTAATDLVVDVTGYVAA